MPPTAVAMEARLEWAGMPPDQLIGIEPVREQPITAERLTVSAEMTERLPVHFPVAVINHPISSASDERLTAYARATIEQVRRLLLRL